MNARRTLLCAGSIALLFPFAASAKEWTFDLDRVDLEARLAEAPHEFTDAARKRETLVSLPRPDGKIVRFRVEESPILSPAMTDKYAIHTYAARGIDERSAIARLELGPSGFHGFVLAPSGSFLIEPEQLESGRYRSIAYEDKALREAARCVADDVRQAVPQASASNDPAINNTAGTISIYRLAASADGEFTAQNGGTVASALEAITNVINHVNLIYRVDFGIHLDLVENEDQLILTQPNISILPSGDLECEGGGTCLQADCLLTGSQCMADGIIGSANYDVAVVFDKTHADGGASGKAEIASVCGSHKGRGATGGTFIDLAAHEIGHMFGGHHTFNDGSNGSCGKPDQRDAAYAFEPDSGSTIMSYGGTCGAANLQPSRDPQFHANNVHDVLDFIQTGQGATCVDHAFSGNYGPVLQFSPGTHTIPKQTPFILETGAYDPNGDIVTVAYDESDTGAASPPEGDDGTRPIFRSYPPTESLRRSFPSEIYVYNFPNSLPPATIECWDGNTCLTGETLPATSRTLHFSVILRDGVDGVTFTDAAVTVDTGSGPFAVTQPTATTFWTEGTRKTVTWNTAGTQNAPVSCQNVRILFSKDDGQTWPYVLAASTPNDGSETVTLPFEVTSGARIKVEAVGNVFYDVSDSFIVESLHVTNTADSGRGSLRQAILDADDWPSGATIPLEISGSGVRTIQVASQLPAITKPVILDGWDLGGATYTGPPLLELDGAGCPDVSQGVSCDGLTVQADNTFINGLIVRGFSGNGIVLRGAAAYAGSVQNCYVGTDATGATAARNGKSGILIDGGYGDPVYGNFIHDNLISGNQVGITVNGGSANGTIILSNKIGTNAAGNARIPNYDDGVRIVGAPNTRIGQPGAGNVIAGNGTAPNGLVDRFADAIDVSGTTATGTIIQGNILGLDASGANGLYNTAVGIRITGAPNTRIGGTAAGARNVIGDDGTVNYHSAHCVVVGGAASSGTVIQGNQIGTDVTGTLDRGCRGAGVYVDGAPGVQIGGTTAAARNLISGNNDNGGVWITNGATGAQVQGNYIGTDITGTVALPNYAFGVELASGGNTIGGTAPGAGNVISGNAQRGIDLYEIAASNNVIQGNLIGTNAAGTAAIGNGVYGIALQRSENNLIGGTAPGARNVISGNGADGIYISGSSGSMAQGNVIQGNYIGTDINGTAGIGNTIGVELYYVANATVGGSAPGAGNVIAAGRSGNAGVRIASYGLATSGIVIQGNLIGTNAAGTAALGNTGEGIWGAITGTASILGNVVAASGYQGISLGQGSFTVQGNWVGTDVTGTRSLGNAYSGIYLTSPAACVIGGTGPGEGNVVAFNGATGTGTAYAGVSVAGNAAGQTVRGNRIYSNTGLGIDLHSIGITPNDACDGDTGANGIQNFPALTSATQSGSSTHVKGTLNSTASSSFTIDFYANAACDALGNGEGASYLGSTTVSTDGSCNGSFDVVVPASASGVVTATATDAAGNTSEFSACRTIGPSPVAEVTGVTWISRAELTWAAASGATTYRILRGASSSLPGLLDASSDSCTRFSGSALDSGPILTENPSTSGSPFYWYLVVGSNGTDDGPYGSATAGARTANESGSCP